jgi:hypothetical protein
MQIGGLGHGGIDQLQEAEETPVAMPAVTLGDDRAAGEIAGGGQAGGAVPDVVVDAALQRRVRHRHGAVWPRAWACDFSPAAKTTSACSGGDMKRPMTWRTLAMKPVSVLSFHISVAWA